MPQGDWVELMVMGGVFILLGLGAFYWGKQEEKSYYDTISKRDDTREFLEHWPPRPQFGALKIGGWIAVPLGLLMMILGTAFWLTG